MTFPHHKHIGPQDRLTPTDQPGLNSVLQEVAAWLYGAVGAYNKYPSLSTYPNSPQLDVNSENALAQFTLIRRNRCSSSGFSRNLRKEVSKQDKIYFWDLGVRNVAIDNLKPLTERDDVGALWENFVLAERLKWLHYHQTLASLYFWRTYTGAEIDIVEEREGGLYAYECKTPLPNALNLYHSFAFKITPRGVKADHDQIPASSHRDRPKVVPAGAGAQHERFLNNLPRNLTYTARPLARDQRRQRYLARNAT